ncbi:MAG: SDR family oxidoreductase [Anaerolineae bacterium]|nr:SDR family oxidoreductase [Anaerolineae bacterium]
MPSTTFDFSGQVAIVTGGGRGIGSVISRNLAGAGASVVIADRNLPAAQALADELNRADCTAFAIEVDVTSKADVERLIAAALQQFGKIDILVNNAGVNSFHLLVDIPEAEWDRLMAVNAKGAFLCCQAVAPHMIERRYGRIINMASQVGITGQRYMAHYAASKFAIVGLTQSAALELGPYGITVNAICPGTVSGTDMHAQTNQILSVIKGVSAEALVAEAASASALGRVQDPQDVADAILFLASERASYITGEALNVNGGTEFH